ncbi:hypothetical protein SCHPADRAFT_836717 [Schizopora paradoxa]|uniref:Uncharacterized protein n=1 Tax=Schizopora paradoxa TaxID=27342 RepID=A0A0H2RRL1_9AGAM|nr:hypothetical protein SCHPADRAFT_836717 [Schizopora paradoxa]
MSLRRPPLAYIHARRNGFDESDAAFPSQLDEKDGIDAQELAHFVMNNLGQPIPTLAEMKTALDAPKNATSLVQEINTLKKEQLEFEVFLREVSRANDGALDFYFQTDDLKYRENDDEWKEHYRRLEKFQRLNTQLEKTGFCDTLERSRYEYVRRLTELQKRRAEMEEREEMERRVREAQFPQSVREYHAMSSRAAQLRVARFLMADSSKQDQMSTQSGWAWRQTQPLIKEYTANEMFRGEVGELVQVNASRDPRSRA